LLSSGPQGTLAIPVGCASIPQGKLPEAASYDMFDDPFGKLRTGFRHYGEVFKELVKKLTGSV